MPTTAHNAPQRAAAIVIDITEKEFDAAPAIVDLFSDADDHKPPSRRREREADAIAAVVATAVAMKANKEEEELRAMMRV